jgi:hypothetical protein
MPVRIVIGPGWRSIAAGTVFPSAGLGVMIGDPHTSPIAPRAIDQPALTAEG